MQIVIAGLGVMGASLALAIKNTRKDVKIFGFDFENILDEALRRQIIDEKIKNWPDDCAGKDIIFLATPVNIIKNHIAEINPFLGPETIITDLGSTKQELSEFVLSTDFRATYIGGHPMTGAEKSGIDAANQLLYENAFYILTTSSALLDKKAQKLTKLLSDIKARVLVLKPDVHDRIMAVISHLPQLLAIALVNMAGEKNSPDFPCLDLAAGGFRDLTRIASSSASVWRDIISSNKNNINAILGEFIKALKEQQANLDGIDDVFNRANHFRNKIPLKGKGFISPLTDILVYVDDQMGVIAKISNALSQQNVDIRDIELLKVREKEGGVFRLSFDSRNKALEAIDILKTINYDATLKD